VILILEGKRKVMGSFAVNPWVKILGWAATAAMAVAVAAMVLA
jgi:Mn2+/Fe2+ NRAMP family transporter